MLCRLVRQAAQRQHTTINHTTFSHRFTAKNSFSCFPRTPGSACISIQSCTLVCVCVCRRVTVCVQVVSQRRSTWTGPIWSVSPCSTAFRPSARCSLLAMCSTCRRSGVFLCVPCVTQFSFRFHHVTALEPSISVSIWTRNEASEVYEQIKHNPLPIKRAWCVFVRVFVHALCCSGVILSALLLCACSWNHWLSVWASTKHAHSTLLFVLLPLFTFAFSFSFRFVDWALLENRYRFIGPDPSTQPLLATRQRYCADANMQNQLLDEV